MPDVIPDPLPPATPYPRNARSLTRLREVEVSCWVLSLVAVLAWGSEAWVRGAAPWLLLPFALVAIVVLVGGALYARVERTLRLLVHPNGLATELGGTVVRRIFWQDVVNVIEEPGAGVFVLYSHTERIAAPIAQLEKGEELRERIGTEWDNLWGYKASTFREIAYYYPPSAQAFLEERMRAERARVAIGVMLAAAGILIGIVGPWLGWWSWVFAGVSGLTIAGAIVAAVSARESRRLDAALACARSVGGIQLGEKELKVISPAGELREILFADIEELDVTPGAPMRFRLKGGEVYTIHREIAYFEKFRLWLIDAGKEQGVKLRGDAPLRGS